MKITALRPLLSADEIEHRVRELGARIAEDYAGEPVLAVCVLRGAVMFFTDLVRAIGNERVSMDFIRIASYGAGTVSGDIIFSKELETDVAGKNVLIVEDIVDTGKSMHFLLEHLGKKRPKSLKVATLVDKRERRTMDVQVDYAGFVLDDGFIVGYGLDFNEEYRGLRDICVAECSD